MSLITVGMYGSLRGIIGVSVPRIGALELDDKRLLDGEIQLTSTGLGTLLFGSKCAGNIVGQGIVEVIGDMYLAPQTG